MGRDGLGATAWAIALILVGGCIANQGDSAIDAGVSNSPAVGSMRETCPPSQACTPTSTARAGAAYTLHVSNCMEVGHTLHVPSPIFSPVYPPGTEAAIAGVTIVWIDAMICEHATDNVTSMSPFHVAVFGASIDPPGPSADDASQSFAGYDAISNFPSIVQAMVGAGWKATEGDVFRMDWTLPEAGQPAAPYFLSVPGNEPSFQFDGSRWAEPGSGASESIEHYYTSANDQPVVLKWDVTGTGGGSQPAVVRFSPTTYWAASGAPPTWEAANYFRTNANGTITLEHLSEL